MFSRLREPGGGFSLIASGIAFLILAGFAVLTPIPGVNLLISVALAVAGLGLLWTAWKRSRADRYDLGKLFDAPPPHPEEPVLDATPDDEIGAPYCGWCDEAYAPGTRR